jgi:hypothetical protein
LAFNKSILTKRFELYSVKDPAIDLEKSNPEEYKRTLDPKHLSFKANEVPSTFIVTPLSTTQQIDVTDQWEQNYKGIMRFSILAFRSGVKDITNYCIDGKPLVCTFSNGLLDQEIVELLQDDDLIFEIGQHIINISHGSPFFSKPLVSENNDNA